MLTMVVKSLIIASLRFLLILFARIWIFLQSFFGEKFSKNSKKIRVFNLDLHTSLVADIKSGLNPYDVTLVSWCVSGNNRNFRKFRKVPDPVPHIYAKNWLDIRLEDLEKFRTKYRRYLETFDLFVVCFPPAFFEIFLDFGKPILVLVGTRYEAPYTNHPESWERLNSKLQAGVKSGQVKLVSNNKADVEYIEYFTGLQPKYLPSLCDYTKMQWRPNSSSKVILSKSISLISQIEDGTLKEWSEIKVALGNNYSWRELSRVSEVLVIPYNVSTMTLFELATAGIPVTVPSKKFLGELSVKFHGVLSELTFYQILNLDSSELALGDPNKIGSLSDISWWLDRADFYNLELMPNVRFIDSIEELHLPHPMNQSVESSTLVHRKVKERNEAIFQARQELIIQFLSESKKAIRSATKIAPCDSVSS